MDITVNVPLERFKALESAEIALDTILKDAQKYSVYRDWGREYYLNSLDTLSIELAEKLKKAIESRDHTIEKWRTQDPKSFNKINR